MKNIRIAIWALVGLALIAFITLNLPQKAAEDTAPEIMPIAGFNKGEHFTLTAHTGDAYNSDVEIQDGEYGLLFFGFTHCPSICPTELQKFAAIMDDLPQDLSSKLHPLFITIDPERDTVEAMQSYVPMFHENIIGLTGSPEEIKPVLDAWKIYYTRVEDPQFTEYTMDHSTYSYLVDADMNIVGIYRLQNTPQQIAENIESIIK
jgi:protein SCO1/2